MVEMRQNKRIRRELARAASARDEQEGIEPCTADRNVSIDTTMSETYWPAWEAIDPAMDVLVPEWNICDRLWLSHALSTLVCAAQAVKVDGQALQETMTSVTMNLAY